jgi:hypothetical protein
MRTFDEWSSAGFKILKGSKGTKINGKWYFTKNQVKYSPRRSYYSNIGLGDHKGMDNPHYDYRYAEYESDDHIWYNFIN